MSSPGLLGLGTTDFRTGNALPTRRDTAKTLRLLDASQAGHPSDEFPSGIFEDAPDVMLIIANDGSIRMANHAAEVLTGVGLGKLPGMSVLDLVPPASRDRVRQKLLESKCSGEAEIEFRSAGGNCVVHARWSTVPDPQGCAFFVVARDITERIRQQAFEAGKREVLELLASRRPLPELLEQLCTIAEAQFTDTLFVVSSLLPGGQRSAASSAAGRETAALAPHLPAAGEVGRIHGVLGRGRITLQPSGVPLDAPVACRYRYKLAMSLPGVKDGTAAVFVYRRTCAAPLPYEVTVIEQAAALFEQILEHARLDAQLRRQAYFDSTTELPNHNLLVEFFAETITPANGARAAGILYIDIDNFRLFDEMAGYGFGGEILKTATVRIRDALPEKAMLARIGGDKFAVVVPDAGSTDELRNTAVRIMDSLKKPDRPDSSGPDTRDEPSISASLGIAMYPRDGTDPNTLLGLAHMALDRAKAAGKAQFSFYDEEIGRVAARRLSIHRHLVRALEKKELSIMYQPQFGIAAGEIVGVEALLRWLSPALGQVRPSEFIPVAEQTGLMMSIGTWVLEEASRQAAQWAAQTALEFKVAVNVSAVQLMHPDFVRLVENTLQDSGLDPSRLELEITESVVVTDFDDCAGKLAKLRSLGISVAIDDFGTGYSSLSCLGNLPVNVLKIDRAFISAITPGGRPPLAQTIVTLGHALGMTVTAEGVETKDQLDVLRALRCDAMQGFLAAPPLGPEEFGLMAFPERQGPFHSKSTCRKRQDC